MSLGLDLHQPITQAGSYSVSIIAPRRGSISLRVTRTVSIQLSDFRTMPARWQCRRFTWRKTYFHVTQVRQTASKCTEFMLVRSGISVGSGGIGIVWAFPCLTVHDSSLLVASCSLTDFHVDSSAFGRSASTVGGDVDDHVRSELLLIPRKICACYLAPFGDLIIIVVSVA